MYSLPVSGRVRRGLVVPIGVCREEGRLQHSWLFGAGSGTEVFAGASALVRRACDRDVSVGGLAGRVDAPGTGLRVGVGSVGDESGRPYGAVPVCSVDVGGASVRPRVRVQREVGFARCGADAERRSCRRVVVCLTRQHSFRRRDCSGGVVSFRLVSEGLPHRGRAASSRRVFPGRSRRGLGRWLANVCSVRYGERLA